MTSLAQAKPWPSGAPVQRQHQPRAAGGLEDVARCCSRRVRPGERRRVREPLRAHGLQVRRVAARVVAGHVVVAGQHAVRDTVRSPAWRTPGRPAGTTTASASSVRSPRCAMNTMLSRGVSAVVDDVAERRLLRRPVDAVLAAPVQELGVRHDREGELEAVRVGVPATVRGRGRAGAGRRGGGERRARGERAECGRAGADESGGAQEGAPVGALRRWRMLTGAGAPKNFLTHGFIPFGEGRRS